MVKFPEFLGSPTYVKAVVCLPCYYDKGGLQRHFECPENQSAGSRVEQTSG